MIPLETVANADEKADVRRDRRALTEEELGKLLMAARQRPLNEALLIRHGPRKGQLAAHVRPEVRQRLEQLGRERTLIYMTLVLTGLRRGELATLTWGDLHLDGTERWLTVKAKHAKNRKSESVPVRPDLAAELQAWRAERGDPANGELVFRVPVELVKILKRDLRAAEIPAVDSDGRVIDVHALRHTTATFLAKAGVAPRTAQSIMRHSDLRLTMGAYTDPQLLDQAAAVDALPAIASHRTEQPLPPTHPMTSLSRSLSPSLSLSLSLLRSPQFIASHRCALPA